jgi:hypothetical protein
MYGRVGGKINWRVKAPKQAGAGGRMYIYNPHRTFYKNEFLPKILIKTKFDCTCEINQLGVLVSSFCSLFIFFGWFLATHFYPRFLQFSDFPLDFSYISVLHKV